MITITKETAAVAETALGKLLKVRKKQVDYWGKQAQRGHNEFKQRCFERAQEKAAETEKALLELEAVIKEAEEDDQDAE